jgi:hypothetical protein
MRNQSCLLAIEQGKAPFYQENKLTNPRREILTPYKPTFYHCISRCVRRAYLCGWCGLLKKDFSHRREWVQERLAVLVEIFAIELASYAVMSNHLHTLLHTRPDIAATWTPEEVALRWCKLFPKGQSLSGETIPLSLNSPIVKLIAEEPEKVEKCRQQLCCISWFNRCLNEPIARRANLEDDCKGRFWEGRFKCSRIDSPGGVLACGVYIDLNPIRSGLAETPETSDFTSIQDRIKTLTDACETTELESELSDMPLNKATPALMCTKHFTTNTLSTSDYIELVDLTGRSIKKGKRGSIPTQLEAVLTRLRLKTDVWHDNVNQFGRLFMRIVGDKDALTEAAVTAKKQWFKGKTSARIVFADSYC